MYVFCAVGVFSLSGTQMLFAGSNFLNAGRNFLLAVGNFLFAGLNCGSAVKIFYLSGGKSENDNGSFALSGRNSLFAVANFLNDVVGLRLLYFLKLQLAHLFELWACCSENRFNVFLYISCNVHKSVCCSVKYAVTGNSCIAIICVTVNYCGVGCF